MRAALLVVLPLVMLTAACSGSSSPSAAASTTAPGTVAVTPTTSGVATATPTVSRTTSPAASAPTCRTSQLSLRLGKGGVAAGTAYQPIVLTNHGSSTCALRGYPGVAFAASTGGQVGSAASRNPQQAVTTILITPDSSASALLGIADYRNYPPRECLSHPVSGLRVYPPGNTAAVYVPFQTASAACSTHVGQLYVAAVVTGSTGQ